ncbi:GNAT family N-acetyltransferase [Hymenobacter daeguensis]
MIPLITQTARLTILSASRALLTAELHKPHYFPVLLGAALPATWPPSTYERAIQENALAQLSAGGRDAAGWYGWYALRKADDAAPRTLVGMGGFLGPPDATGTAEIDFAIAPDWRGQGLGTELVGGLVQQAEATGLVHQLVAHVPLDEPAAQQVLLRNGFAPAEALGTADRLRFARAVVPAPQAA